MAYNNKLDKEITQTVYYSDIFNFPLSRQELWRFLISDRNVTKEDFIAALAHLPKDVRSQNGWYFFKGRDALVEKRKKQHQELKKKFRLATHVAHVLSFIPTISFIGLTGGLAAGNVQKDDDIDLFIITRKKKLFMTRFWILLLLEAAGLRRKAHEKGTQAANKVCVNLLIDESAFLWPRSKQDLYVASEIAHMKPLFERNGTYAAFLKSNKWVTKFLPNAFDEIERSVLKTQNNYYTLAIINIIIAFSPIPAMLVFIQKLFIKKKQTTEIVKNNMLAFHPYDYRKETLHAYSKMLAGKLK